MKPISKAYLQGTISAPSSKSELLRAIIIASVAHGSSQIIANNRCDDVNALTNSLLSVGISIDSTEEGYRIDGGSWPARITFHCGESGFLYRCLPFITSALCEQSELTSEGSLRHRKHNALYELMNLAAIPHSYTHDNSSLRIERSAYPSRMRIGNLDSSQPLSGLLLSLPLVRKATQIHHTQVDSYGYIELTNLVMRKFGVEIQQENANCLLYDGLQTYQPQYYAIEGDWSAAALLMASAAADGRITIEGLNPNSSQPDRAIVEAMRMANAHVDIEPKRIHVIGHGANALRHFAFDVNPCPDIAPALAILAAQISGKSTLSGISRLKNKESNRLNNIIQLLKLYGIKCYLENEAIAIEGGTLRSGVTIQPHGDHRIAMAGALLATLAQGESYVLQPECVNKSYPNFWSDLHRLSKSK